MTCPRGRPDPGGMRRSSFTPRSMPLVLEAKEWRDVPSLAGRGPIVHSFSGSDFTGQAAYQVRAY